MFSKNISYFIFAINVNKNWLSFHITLILKININQIWIARFLCIFWKINLSTNRLVLYMFVSCKTKRTNFTAYKLAILRLWVPGLSVEFLKRHWNLNYRVSYRIQVFRTEIKFLLLERKIRLTNNFKIFSRSTQDPTKLSLLLTC